MPDASQFVGNSIEELLVSLADGVREAQLALNSGPLIDERGRPLATYQLPYLDFTVQADMQTRTDKGGRPVALMLMVRSSGASNTDQRVSSTISGRLVATPPAEGLPVPRIGLTLGRVGKARVTLELDLGNSAGERLGNQRVEFNIDDDSSRALSAARSVPSYVRSPGTRLVDAIVTTDAKGQATADLAVSAVDQGTKAVIVVVAAIGPFSARVAVPLDMAVTE